MVSEQVKQYVLEAGAYLKQAEQMSAFDTRVLDMCTACEGTLEAINVFIHDEEPWKLISEKNKELNDLFNNEFKKRVDTIKKDKGSYWVFCQQKQIVSELMIWKCEQKLSFYDFLTKKYDV